MNLAEKHDRAVRMANTALVGRHQPSRTREIGLKWESGSITLMKITEMKITEMQIIRIEHPNDDC